MSESLLPPNDLDALCQVFRDAEKPPSDFRVGLEAEKFGLTRAGSPFPYAGPGGVEGLFERLTERGFSPIRETHHGPVIALQRGGQSVTLEPAAQVELSGAPAVSVHELATELFAHLTELDDLLAERDLYWVHLGFQPLARPEELPWVPKQRYGVMREYLPSQGARGLDMMQRTATVQVNLDFASETDAMFRLQTLLKLTPLLQAMTLNAPFREGSVSPLLSERLDVWLNMDPRRSGLLEDVWEAKSPSYRDYARWALRAGMFLFKRGATVHLNTGQSFADFLRDGFRGERATATDWKLHLGTLFPEVRLKTTLEVRGIDAQDPTASLALPALLAGLAYDSIALEGAAELLAGLQFGEAVQLQRALLREGLATRWHGKPLRELALRVLELARGGLERRFASGRVPRSEVPFLAPLEATVERGLTPAEGVLERFRQSGLSMVDFLPGLTPRSGRTAT